MMYKRSSVMSLLAVAVTAKVTVNVYAAEGPTEEVKVIGIPTSTSIMETAQPISVLRGEELRNQQAATLGDSLDNEVGVHTNFHGNVASTPIIRGLGGPRVQVTQNSLDVSDVSRVGPDHAVASEVSTAEQIEVLRGPATLFYGSGAIGGVVNVVDTRVPVDTETRGEWYLSHDTVNNQNLGSINLNTGKDKFAFHVDGFLRESDDYEVPVAPEQGEVHSGDQDDVVANSSEQSSGFTLGTSYLLDNGYVGISFGRLNREYGIPGHSHGGEDEEVSVYADLEQDRVQIISELDIDGTWLQTINTRVGYTDYTHAEVEEGETGTLFANETTELKLDLLHQAIREWNGGVVLHYKNSEGSAQGEEAFTPASETETFALAWVEERRFGNFLLQLGARVEQVTLDADNVRLPGSGFHSHSDEEEPENEEEESGLTRVFESDFKLSPMSVSAGVVWDFAPDYNFAVSISRSERAPSAAELLSFGPHIGAQSYEVGALFELHQEGDESHFELNNSAVALETANNIDLTLRKHEGEWRWSVNAFFNQIDNYYYQAATGLYAESGHDHDHDHDHGAEEDEHSDELPVYLFTPADAEFWGLEAESVWQVTPVLQTTVFADYVNAQLRQNGDELPRIPPLRLGARIDYQWNQISTNVSWTRYQKQERIAPMETSTDGYNWVDATVTWQLPLVSTELAVFAKVENLTDAEARVHTSFLKDIAPKPGRNFRIGLRGTF